MRWKLKTLTASCVCLSMVSCTAMETLVTGDEGRIHITADADGIKAWSDMLAAQAQIAKDSPNKKGASWQLREMAEQQKTMRYQIRFQQAEE